MESFQIRQAILNVCLDTQELTRQVANAIVQIAHKAIELNGQFVISLSGGKTPKSLYALLAQEEFAQQVCWEKVHLFWGDERCVPRDHVDSNYGMVFDALICQVRIPGENIHAPSRQADNPRESAIDYQDQLRQFFTLKENDLPAFDLVLLGLGLDGHTASIFPGEEAICQSKELVTAVYVEKFDAYRLTLTLPVINNARNVFFLVEGKDKAQILCQVLQGTTARYPAQMVAPKGHLVWWLDGQAAAQLDLKLMSPLVSRS